MLFIHELKFCIYLLTDYVQRTRTVKIQLHCIMSASTIKFH